MGHSTISMANFNSFLYVYQAGYPFGAAIFNRHPGIFLEFFCYFRDDLWMANVCVFIKIVVKPTIYSYHLDGKLYYSIIIQLYHNPVEGADGKWVISHGIKSRIVGSEWDYNGMIICIYIYNAGWWFGTWILWLSLYWECHRPNWLSYFSEG